MMNIGQQKWYWKEHFVYMKMRYQTMYVNTHALMGIIVMIVSYMDSLDLSDISDFEDYMLTTSNDEDLPGLEEVPYWTLVCLNTYLTFRLQCIALNSVHYCLNTDWNNS